MAEAQLSNLSNRVWGGLALRGVVAVLFGIMALTRTGVTVLALVYLFGVFAFMDGIFALVASAKIAQMRGRWWPMLLIGLVGVALGVLAFARPAGTAVGLVYYIAAWAVATGILEIVAAVRLRRLVEGEWMLGVVGVLSIAVGIMIAIRPDAGIVSLTWVIGAYAIVAGVILLGLAFRIRGVQRRVATT